VEYAPEHFRAKWTPVRVKKMRRNKNIERRFRAQFQRAVLVPLAAMPGALQCVFAGRSALSYVAAKNDKLLDTGQ
jgi:hypothetical protein